MGKYETVGGNVSRADTFTKLLDLLAQAQEQSLVLSHLHMTEDNDTDKLIARGWAGIAELLQKMQHQITELATGKLFLQ